MAGPRKEAECVDRMVCYESALQPRPQDDVDFYLSAWKHGGQGRGEPLLLREDFSGSGMVSMLWAKTRQEREAWAVDFDPEVHEWGMSKHLSRMAEGERARVRLVTCDVFEWERNGVPVVDVVVANNFSWQCFKVDADLVKYLRCALAGLRPGGMFVVDAFGGTSISRDSREEISKHDIVLDDGRRTSFEYLYEQMRCKPDGEMEIGVSFMFADGSVQKHAFKYEWRVRPTAAVCEMMREVGFSKVLIFADYSDNDGLYRHGERPKTEREWSMRCGKEDYVSCYVVAFAPE